MLRFINQSQENTERPREVRTWVTYIYKFAGRCREKALQGSKDGHR